MIGRQARSSDVIRLAQNSNKLRNGFVECSLTGEW